MLRGGGKLIISDVGARKYLNVLDGYGVKDLRLYRPSKLVDFLYLRQVVFLLGIKLESKKAYPN